MNWGRGWAAATLASCAVLLAGCGGPPDDAVPIDRTSVSGANIGVELPGVLGAAQLGDRACFWISPDGERTNAATLLVWTDDYASTVEPLGIISADGVTMLPGQPVVGGVALVDSPSATPECSSAGPYAAIAIVYEISPK